MCESTNVKCTPSINDICWIGWSVDRRRLHDIDMLLDTFFFFLQKWVGIPCKKLRSLKHYLAHKLFQSTGYNASEHSYLRNVVIRNSPYFLQQQNQQSIKTAMQNAIQNRVNQQTTFKSCQSVLDSQVSVLWSYEGVWLWWSNFKLALCLKELNYWQTLNSSGLIYLQTPNFLPHFSRSDFQTRD